ncbi:molecular chaperone [Escherichia coli B9:H18]
MKMKYLKLISILAILPFYSNADKPDVRISSITFSQSRVIFHESDTHGVQFSLSNQSENPYLVQTKVTTLDGEKSKTYITTPPLFRLDVKEQTSIKVVKIGGESDNEENMEFICVKPIPPKENKGNDKIVNVVINNCIKLIYRPSNVSRPTSDNFFKNVKWKIVNKELYITNETSNYLNLNKVIYAGKNLPVTYVPPHKTKSLGKVSQEDSKTVMWNYVDDFGEISKTLESKLDRYET